MFFWQIKKIFAQRRRGAYKRERATSLHECLEESPSRSLWRPWYMVFVVMPAIYYIHNLYLSNTNSYKYNVSVEKVDVEIESPSRKNESDEEYQETLTKTVETTSSRAETTAKGLQTQLPMCILEHHKLGQISPITSIKDKQYPMVKKGGHYSPPDCVSRHKVGILVPYRDRATNLAVFLSNIHPFLINQKLEYRIFVVEQYGTDMFNKGRLFNAGFKEIFKFGNWKCVVFHDVDLLPLDERILYTCPTYPRHMCGTVIQKLHDPKYHALFGGVTSMSPEHFKKVNGYSNLYWGWGGEDNDIFWRLRASRIPVVRYNRSISRYTALPHTVINKNKYRYQLLRTATERYLEEGLNTVEYKLISVTLEQLYTHILVDVNPFKDNVTVIMKVIQ